MTIQTAVLIETLKALGAEVRWASCNIFSTQDHAAAAIAAGGTPVFAYKGESLDEYWDFTHRIFEFGDQGPNMILDDGGDATLLVHLGSARRAGSLGAGQPDQRGGESLFRRHQEAQAEPAGTRKDRKEIKGVTEETTTGVHRLYQMAKDEAAAVPGHQRQRLGHQVQVRQHLRLPRVAGRRHQARDRRDGRRQGRGRRAATARSARARRRRCAGCRPRCGSPRSTRSARCRRRWKATAS